MAIRIQTEETFIPVEIGKVELQFKVDDESLNRIMNAVDDFNEKGEKLEKKIEAENMDREQEFEETKGFVKESYDYLLGDGAFDKVYEQTPSLQITVKYFLDIAEGLETELKERGIESEQSEKMKKYIKDTKKKDKKK